MEDLGGGMIERNRDGEGMVKMWTNKEVSR